MEPETITIPTELAFDVLEKMRLVTVYLDPPDDFRPSKWPTPQEYAEEVLYPAYKALFDAIRDQIPSRCPECGGRLGHNDNGRCDTCAAEFVKAAKGD